jgi:hypothetical protein
MTCLTYTGNKAFCEACILTVIYKWTQVKS